MGFIAVVGESGVGKTTLINALVKKYGECYARAVSFTTRTPREDDNEYHFVSEEELIEMLELGQIKYIDEVFDAKYAMLSDVFVTSEYDYIKEIHPNNIYKIKQNVNSLITVKVITSNTTDNRGRYDTFDYDSYDADIVFNYDREISLDIMAKDLHRKIVSIKLQQELGLPNHKEIDSLNRLGYDMVSHEFVENKRITTANFHDASREFFSEILEKIQDEDSIIEIGSGNGWLSKLYGKEIPSIDISDKMQCGVLKKTGSASNINAKSEEYDIVFASLCDPYLYPVAIAEMLRILKQHGKIVISTPSYEWANLNRKNSNKTKFLLESGKLVEVYSFIYSYQQLVNIGERLGFIISKYHSYALPYDVENVSEAIIVPCNKNKIDYRKLKIVDCYILRKENNI